MTKKDIEREISRERKRILTLCGKLNDIKFDIKATRQTIRFWEKELKKAKED